MPSPRTIPTPRRTTTVAAWCTSGVDLGHYSRERILGTIRAFLQEPDARGMLLIAPTQERAALLGLWARDVYGEATAERLQTLTFDEVRAGGYLRPGTEPTNDEIQNAA